MTTAFLAGYLFLCVLILGESVLIHSMFSIVIERGRTRERAIRATWHGRLIGNDVPDFRVRYVSRKGKLTRGDLFGQSSVLLFVSPKDFGDPALFRWLLATTRAKIEATRYFAICAGSTLECGALLQLEKDTPATQSGFETATDDDGDATRRFGITSTPALVSIDEVGCVMKAGQAAFRPAADAPARQTP